MCAAICVAPCTPCRATHLVFLFAVSFPLFPFLPLYDTLSVRIEFEHDKEQDGKAP